MRSERAIVPSAGALRILVSLAAILLLTLWAYGPLPRNGFIDFDDTGYVSGNSTVLRGLTLEGVRWAFGFHESNWHPLAWLSHLADVQLFGPNPGAHHLVSLFVHLLNTVLVFAVWRGLTGAMGGSLLVAALFALHPLHVESVAWLAERKDLLAAFFFLLAILAYRWWLAHRSVRRMVVLLALFVAALLSKPMALTLPFVLLVLDGWPLGRVTAEGPKLALVSEKTALFLLSGASAAVTLFAQRGAVRSAAVFPLAERLKNAIVAYLAYLGMTFRPARLAIFYPHRGSLVTGGELILAVALLAVVTMAALLLCQRVPALLAGWCWFLGMLVPVIGLVQVGWQGMADRYTYLPLIGVFVALVWGAQALRRGLGPAGRAWLMPVVAIGLLALAALTRAQVGYWADGPTLWRHAAQVRPDSWLAHGHLGAWLAERGNGEAALPHLRAAVRLEPRYADGHQNLGLLLAGRGQLLEAEAEYRLAIRLDPLFAAAHNNLGLLLARTGRGAEAREHYVAALRLDPRLAEAHTNLGSSLAADGRLDEAAIEFREAARLDPRASSARFNLARILAGSGRYREAADQLREVVRIDPADREARALLEEIDARTTSRGPQ